MTKWTLKREGDFYVVRDIEGRPITRDVVLAEAFLSGMNLAYFLRRSVIIEVQQ